MAMIGPVDVAQMFDMLQTIQTAEAKGNLPPGTYARALADAERREEMNWGGDATVGTGGNEGFTGRWTGEVTRAPWAGEYDMPGNFERRQRMANSLAEDAMLRELLGSERRRTEEDTTEGVFALARYPGIEHAIWQAEAGGQPPGMPMPFGSPGLHQAEAAERKEWARRQRELLGMDRRIGAREWGGFRRAAQGLGARERRNFFRQFLRG